MNVDIGLIEDWCDALESGEYEQGLRRLYREREEQHCCLGVLSCVMGEDPRDGLSRYPDEIDPGIRDVFEMDRFIPLNDHHGLTFDQIAYVIRRELLAPLKRAVAKYDREAA